MIRKKPQEYSKNTHIFFINVGFYSFQENLGLKKFFSFISEANLPICMENFHILDFTAEAISSLICVYASKASPLSKEGAIPAGFLFFFILTREPDVQCQ